MSIKATHSDGRSVRRGTLAVDPGGLTFGPERAASADRVHLPVDAIRRSSVEGPVSRWDAVPRRRVRVDLADGVSHWFVVEHPDATVSLIEAVMSDPPPHPAIVERRRRDAGRRTPLGFLRAQLVVGLLLTGGAVARTFELGHVRAPDAVVMIGVTLTASFALFELWRHRRYRLSP
jgi:hypothetical protein